MTEFEKQVEAAMFDALDPPQNQGELWIVLALAPRVAAAISKAANSGWAGARHDDAIADGLAALRGTGDPTP